MKAWSASSPAFSTSAIVAVETLAFWPSSQTIGSLSSALFACHPVGCRAFGGGHFPLIRGRLHEHHARGSAAFAHVLVRLANAAAAAGGEIAPGALALHALAGRRIFDAHLRPVALELLGDELRETGDGALPHLGAHYTDVHGVVGRDRDPDADLRRAILRACDVRTKRQAQTEGEAATDGGGPDDERAAIHLHAVLPRPWRWRSLRRGSLRAPAGTCRSDRCW